MSVRQIYIQVHENIYFNIAKSFHRHSSERSKSTPFSVANQTPKTFTVQKKLVRLCLTDAVNTIRQSQTGPYIYMIYGPSTHSRPAFLKHVLMHLIKFQLSSRALIETSKLWSERLIDSATVQRRTGGRE